MIRLATKNDVPKIMENCRACANHMIANGIYQWNNEYPNTTAFLNDIAREELFVLTEEDKIIGTIVVSTLMDQEYVPIKWLTPNKNNFYIHRLSVHPNYQKKGYAKKLMDFAENIALQKNYNSVRLDTFSKNQRNQRFYEARGYQKLGNIYFPKQSNFPFYCYELVL